jgi:hypothetical protein
MNTEPDGPGEIVSIGVDWLTATAPRDGRDIHLLSIAGSLFETVVKNADDATVWRMQGYDGKSANGLRYGVRKDGAIVQLSGEVAHDHWQSIVRRAANVTRIDLEVTARFDPERPGVGGRAYRAVEEWRRQRERPPQCKAVLGDGRVETVYVGSRSSVTFGRCYDKAAEAAKAEWAGCWRWEVEVKDPLAARLARVLAADRHAEQSIGRYVWDWFAERGGAPAFPPPTGDVHVARPPNPTTDARRLKWLTDQVAPILAALISRGLRADVLYALGLDVGTRRRGFVLPQGDR